MNESGAVVHLRRAPYDVRIDRLSAWGNPFVLGRDGDRFEVIAKFLDWVTTSDATSAAWIREHVHELHGKTLGCWCAPPGGVTVEDLPWVCHGQVLLSLADDLIGDRIELI
jgi:hypothetical protein